MCCKSKKATWQQSSEIDISDLYDFIDNLIEAVKEKDKIKIKIKNLITKWEGDK